MAACQSVTIYVDFNEERSTGRRRNANVYLQYTHPTPMPKNENTKNREKLLIWVKLKIWEVVWCFRFEEN